MIYEFEVGHYTVEATKNICCAKSGRVLNHKIITRLLKKFRSGYKNLTDQARSVRPKSVDSKAVLLAIEVNTVSSTQRVSGELGILQSIWFVTFKTSAIVFKAAELYLTLLKHYKTFDSPKPCTRLT